MILIVFLILACICIVGLLFVLNRSLRRLLEFDSLMQLFIHDIETNVKYFNKLVNTPTFSNSPEVIQAQHNMHTIRLRLEEYVIRMEELTNKPRKQKVSPRPPKVA